MAFDVEFVVVVVVVPASPSNASVVIGLCSNEGKNGFVDEYGTLYEDELVEDAEAVELVNKELPFSSRRLFRWSLERLL